MGIISGINWTDATWNPWHGCHKVSPGCAHCYMFREKKQYGQDPNTVVRSKTMFDAPLKWKRTGKVAAGSKIFTCSWSDFFIEEADAWRDEAWAIIKATPEYTYQILTKRPERIRDHLPPDWNIYYGYKNVWLGISAENQRWYDKRLPRLLENPAAVYFVSIEPYLDSIDLCLSLYTKDYSRPEWVIAGCESGANRRPIPHRPSEKYPQCLNGFQFLADQCKAAGIPFWMKQMEVNGKVTDDVSLFPQELRVRQFPLQEGA